VGGWSVVQENGNYVLQGIDHAWIATGSDSWSDYTFESKVKLIEGGIHVNYRVKESRRYAIGLSENGMYLMKSTGPTNHTQLVNVELPLGKDWNTIKIVGKGSNIKVYVNNALKINYTDEEPVLNGNINFESLPDSRVYVDDVHVTLDKVDSVVYVGTGGYGIYNNPSSKNWQNLGRTLGGGWWTPWERRMYQFSSILFDPDTPGRVYYGHFPSGFFISDDSGHTWKDSSLGLGNDGIFSLSMHPNNHSILFAGTYNGVSKSSDGGRTWKLKNNGMPSQQWPYTVAIDSNNPNIMYTSTKNGQNKGFCYRNILTFCGVVMKSTDGGESWFKIMNGLNDKNEFYTLLVYPPDHNILFLSTNRGVYISKDAGNRWIPINNGLPSTNNQVRDNVAENLALTPDNRYLILGLVDYGLWKADLLELKKDLGYEENPNVALIDGHVHLFDGGDAVQNADMLVNKMNGTGVLKTVLFGGCGQPYFDKNMYVNGIRAEADSRVFKAYEKYPDRFYPMLSGFDPQNPNSTEYLEQQLATGVWKGLGEIYMVHQDMLNYKTRADNPVMKEIYKLLAKYDVPIFFHHERRDEEDVQALFGEMKANPEVKFVWVHFAHYRSIEELEKELRENPNMYVEIEQSLGFSSEQINLFEKFPDRFLLGTDMGCSSDMLTTQKTTYSEAISLHGKLLKSLSPTTAENMKYKNLEELMKT